MNYLDFIKSKHLKASQNGFDISLDQISGKLFDWQRHVVRHALKTGKYALFEECGLGKTPQALEWSRHVVEFTGKKILITTPLAVAHQFEREGDKFGIPCRYVRTQDDAMSCDESVVVTNYDMLSHFEPSRFGGVVNDESSILKNFSGKTKKMIVEMFRDTPFKLCCTATPSPNDHLELGNHSEHLNVMEGTEMISRWFINDSMKAGNYRLTRHGEKDFWRWITMWAMCISKPSDIGFDDDGFILPELHLYDHVVEVDHSRAKLDGQLIVYGNSSATKMWKEKAETAQDRCNKAREIFEQSPDDCFIIWCDTNDEADRLKKLFPGAIEVRGSESVESKEEKLNAFSDGNEQIIITKPDIAGFGLNWQHCHRQIFVGVSYSFEKLYQALRRSWRFGQHDHVEAHLIYAESEGNIMETIKRKQESHKKMQEAMNEAMRESDFRFGDRVNLAVDIETNLAEGKDWKLYLGDCVQTSKQIADDSIHFTIFSPPFSSLYIYSSSIADMGNCADHDEFFRHFEYLIPELFRITMPGRLCAVHCKDLPLYINRDGAAGIYDFPGELVRTFQKYGWVYHSKVTIWKDPVIEMERTNNHGLLYKNFRLRSEVIRQGLPDYLIVFRKWEGIENGSESSQPVLHDANEMLKYIGADSNLDYRDNGNVQGDFYWRNLHVWQRYASPVWFDIDQTNVLNFKVAKDNRDEKHICPLQLDVIKRAIQLWTNEGDTVLSPFAGIGSEGYMAIELNRRFVGIELKKSYWNLAINYLKAAEDLKKQGDLFETQCTLQE